jgi:hypothetical protein
MCLLPLDVGLTTTIALATRQLLSDLWQFQSRTSQHSVATPQVQIRQDDDAPAAPPPCVHSTAPHRHHPTLNLNLNLKTPWRPIGIRHKREGWVREKSKRYMWSWRCRRSPDRSPRLSGSTQPRDGPPWLLPPWLKSSCCIA